ncbi:MAG: hypothetical protein HY079_12490, partial [Elusimicrobia bacterium]|nr:hypothetical protein [Elusimicrobiota bacterium]
MQKRLRALAALTLALLPASGARAALVRVEPVPALTVAGSAAPSALNATPALPPSAAP